jgi:hypothetical protein
MCTCDRNWQGADCSLSKFPWGWIFKTIIYHSSLVSPSLFFLYRDMPFWCFTRGYSIRRY